MYKSNLSSNYPVAEPSEWLTGSDYKQIDPVFAGRLAYAAKCNKVKIKLTEGYRDTARQTELYNQYLEGKLQSAAKPGTSWHEYRLAVDTSTQPIRGFGNLQLSQYGLCKPISTEGWHIQPIETLNLKGQANREKWAPVEVEDMTKDETLQLIKEQLQGKNSSVSQYAEEVWNQATAEGITDGTNPKGYVTREQCIVIVERAINSLMEKLQEEK